MSFVFAFIRNKTGKYVCLSIKCVLSSNSVPGIVVAALREIKYMKTPEAVCHLVEEIGKHTNHSPMILNPLHLNQVQTAYSPVDHVPLLSNLVDIFPSPQFCFLMISLPLPRGWVAPFCEGSHHGCTCSSRSQVLLSGG